MATADALSLSLSCAICLEVASLDDSVETTCCHHLFCFTCIEKVRPCPSCRQEDFQLVAAHFARRLIGNLTVSCPNDGCMAEVTRSNLAQHLDVHCQYRLMTCPEPQCEGFQCIKKSFLGHLVEKHEQFLLDKYDKMWQMPEDAVRGTRIQLDKKPTAGSSIVGDRTEMAHNNRGRYARLGITGKYYCGGELDGLRCTCCNGRCGPLKGCNCSACMLLDVQKRQLPQGWLVNRDGAAARHSPENPTKYYCGRMIIPNNGRTDRCGPSNGEQCYACYKLNKHCRRYGQIWPHQQM